MKYYTLDIKTILNISTDFLTCFLFFFIKTLQFIAPDDSRFDNSSKHNNLNLATLIETLTTNKAMNIESKISSLD